MKKTVMLLSVLLLLAGCGTGERSGTDGVESENSARAVCVSEEDCWLCGNGSAELEEWGQKNIGLVSLNTFEVMPIQINRYDEAGEQIEKKAGCMGIHGFPNGEESFSAWVWEDLDRGYAEAHLSFRGDEATDPEKAASFLCAGCFDEVVSAHEDGFGVGVIDFSGWRIHVLEADDSGFLFGDYYLHCDWEAGETRRLDILTFYCPLRYEKAE